MRSHGYGLSLREYSKESEVHKSLCWEERGTEMEAPELEFFQWLLEKFIKSVGLEEKTASLLDLKEKLNDALTPMGGG